MPRFEHLRCCCGPFFILCIFVSQSTDCEWNHSSVVKIAFYRIKTCVDGVFFSLNIIRCISMFIFLPSHYRICVYSIFIPMAMTRSRVYFIFMYFSMHCSTQCDDYVFVANNIQFWIYIYVSSGAVTRRMYIYVAKIEFILKIDNFFFV